MALLSPSLKPAEKLQVDKSRLLPINLAHSLWVTGGTVVAEWDTKFNWDYPKITRCTTPYRLFLDVSSSGAFLRQIVLGYKYDYYFGSR